MHIIAHLFNFEYFMDAQLNRNDSFLPFVLSEIGNRNNTAFLNPIRTNETVSLPNAASYLYHFQFCRENVQFIWIPVSVFLIIHVV